MRNSAFRTMTTNSRGVKSSLTRMTLCRRDRSTFISSLILGLVVVPIMCEPLSWGTDRTRSSQHRRLRDLYKEPAPLPVILNIIQPRILKIDRRSQCPDQPQHDRSHSSGLL